MSAVQDFSKSVGIRTSGDAEPEGGGNEKKYHAFPPPVPASELIALYPEPPPPVIDGIVSEGGKLILSASSKAGKTWASLGLAAAVSSGGEWFGFPCAQGDVLFLNFELPAAWLAERIRKMEEAGLSFAHVDAKNLRGCFPDWWDLQCNIREWCKVKSYKLIVLDPIYKMLGAISENDNAQIAEMLGQLERIAEQNNAAVMFSHHFSKGNKSDVASMDRASGAGVFARDPDAILSLTSHEEEDCYSLEADLRNYPRVEPSVWEFTWPIFELRDDLDAARLKSKGGAKKKGSNEDVLACFESPAKPLTYAELRRRVAERLGCVERTAERRIKEAERMLDNSTGLYLPKENDEAA